MKKIAIILFAALGLSASASASVIKADFSARSDLPYCTVCGPNLGPVTLEALQQTVGNDVELEAGATLNDPSERWGGQVWIDLAPVNKTLTLLSQDEKDFETFVAEISNIVFSANEIITGVSLVSNELAVLYTDELDWPALAPDISFTKNSMSIKYDSTAASYFYFTGQKAVFQFTTEEVQAEVPEPASTALLALGLAGLAGIRRRRKA